MFKWTIHYSFFYIDNISYNKTKWFHYKGLVENEEMAFVKLLPPLSAAKTAAARAPKVWWNKYWLKSILTNEEHIFWISRARAPEGRQEPRTSSNKLSSCTDWRKSSRLTRPSLSLSRRPRAISDKSRGPSSGSSSLFPITVTDVGT